MKELALVKILVYTVCIEYVVLLVTFLVIMSQEVK